MGELVQQHVTISNPAATGAHVNYFVGKLTAEQLKTKS